MTERERKLSIAMNVAKDADLPEAGWNVAEFINILREQIEDDFDLDIQVGVNPVIDEQPEESSPYIGFVNTNEIVELSEDELEELDEDDNFEEYEEDE